MRLREFGAEGFSFAGLRGLMTRYETTENGGFDLVYVLSAFTTTPRGLKTYFGYNISGVCTNRLFNHLHLQS